MTARRIDDEAEETALRPLTLQEIDQRIQCVVEDVAASGRAATEDGPRWISAAELVRRVRPFVCRN